MSASTAPKLKQFARRLLVCEVGPAQPTDIQHSAVFRVCAKLRGPLGKLMGIAGFRSLLSRALVLAAAEVPWLAALQIEADGSLEGLNELEVQLDWPATAEGEIVLVAQLLGLLVTFIGAGLTVRLLHDIWPELDDLNF
ncbi:MAG: hypothetical protein ABIP85_06920 [Chthoniobacteraceae bacterium]